MDSRFGDAEEQQRVSGQGAEAVAQFLFEGVQMSRAGGEADAAEEIEAQGRAFDVVRGKIAGEGQAELDRV